MACCAFALFVIGQIAALLVAICRTLGFSSSNDRSPRVNPATAWQLRAAPSAGPSPPPAARWRRTLLVPIVLLEIGLVATGATWASGHLQSASTGAFTAVVSASWCGSALSAPDPVRSPD